MIYTNTDQLKRWLEKDGLDVLASQSEFEVDEESFKKHLADLQRRPQHEQRDAAAFRCLTLRSSLAQSKPETTPAQVLLQHQQLLQAHSAIVERERFERASQHAALLTELKSGLAETVDAAKAAEVAIDEAATRLAATMSTGNHGVVSEIHASAQVRHRETQESVRGLYTAIEDARVERAKADAHLESSFSKSLQQFSQRQAGVESSIDKFRHDFVGESNVSRAAHESLNHRVTSVETLIKRCAIGAGVLFLILLLATFASAQNVNEHIVVSTCGTPPSGYPSASQRGPGTANTNGQECVTVGGTVTTTAATGYTAAVVWTSAVTALGASTPSDTAIVTVGAGTRVVLNEAQVMCGSTVSVAVTATMGFGAATIPASGSGLVFSMPATAASQFQGFHRGTGFPGVIGVGASGEDLRLTMSTPTGGQCVVSIVYFTEST